MHAPPREHDLEWTFSLDRQLEPRELFAQTPSVVGVDEDVLLDQILLDVGRSAVRHDLAPIDDADVIRLLRLLEVVRGEEDRRAALAADRREVFPQRAPARRGGAQGWAPQGKHPCVVGWAPP